MEVLIGAVALGFAVWVIMEIKARGRLAAKMDEVKAEVAKRLDDSSN